MLHSLNSLARSDDSGWWGGPPGPRRTPWFGCGGPEGPPRARAPAPRFMKKASAKKLDDDLPPGYDLSKVKGGIRGKYHRHAVAGTNLVLIEPELAEVFRAEATAKPTRRRHVAPEPGARLSSQS